MTAADGCGDDGEPLVCVVEIPRGDGWRGRAEAIEEIEAARERHRRERAGGGGA